jgi:hypothetical protein
MDSRLHLAAVAVLTALVRYGSWSLAELTEIGSALIPPLHVCVHNGDLDTQPAILTLLRVIVIKHHEGSMGSGTSLSTMSVDRSHQRTRSNVGAKVTVKDDHFDYTYLSEIISTGVSVPANRPVLTDWLDFIHGISTPLSSTATPMVYSISETICDQVLKRLHGVGGEARRAIDTGDTAEEDIPSLLQSAEQIVKGVVPGSSSTATPGLASASSEPAGLFGYVSTVLVGDSHTARETKSAVSLVFHVLVNLCTDQVVEA